MNIPLTVRDAAAAIRGPLRSFLESPDATGAWVHVEELGVDVTVHVVHERAGAYVWRCECGHDAVRAGPLTAAGERFTCGLCGVSVTERPPFRGDAKFRTYGWAVRWTRPGREGWAVGPMVDEGTFNDHQLMMGLGRFHAVLTYQIHEMERVGVTTMEDLRTLQRLEVTSRGATS